MVPLMLAASGASFVTRRFERRSIYTVRVAPADPNTGKTATGQLV